MSEERVFKATIDGGPTQRGAIGLIVLAADQVCEHDMRRVIPQDRLPLYVTRVEFESRVTVETLGAMRHDLDRAAELLVPGSNLTVIAFGCTSGTIIIGESDVFAKLRRSHPRAECTSPPTAAMAAFKALGLRRIAVLTPYQEPINRRVRDWFEDRGISIVRFGAFHLATEPEIAGVTAETVMGAATQLNGPDIDGVFISCTGMRALDSVESIERVINKPVVTSNQAMAWHALRLAGYRESRIGYGRLLTENIS